MPKVMNTFHFFFFVGFKIAHKTLTHTAPFTPGSLSSWLNLPDCQS